MISSIEKLRDDYKRTSSAMEKLNILLKIKKLRKHKLWSNEDDYNECIAIKAGIKDEPEHLIRLGVYILEKRISRTKDHGKLRHLSLRLNEFQNELNERHKTDEQRTVEEITLARSEQIKPILDVQMKEFHEEYINAVKQYAKKCFYIIDDEILNAEFKHNLLLKKYHILKADWKTRHKSFPWYKASNEIYNDILKLRKLHHKYKKINDYVRDNINYGEETFNNAKLELCNILAHSSLDIDTISIRAELYKDHFDITAFDKEKRFKNISLNLNFFKKCLSYI